MVSRNPIPAPRSYRQSAKLNSVPEKLASDATVLPVRPANAAPDKGRQAAIAQSAATRIPFRFIIFPLL